MKRHTRTIVPVLFGLAAIGLAGCGQSAEKTFGLQMTPPDAFDVGTEAPLSIPPEMSQLPKPIPGEPRPQQVSSSQQAEEVLSPQSALTNNAAGMGPGQQAILNEAGPPPAPHIRSIVNSEANLESRSPGFVSSLMFWNKSQPAPQLVNAPGEQRRLQENSALGAPVTQGNTPQETAPSTGFFGRLLNIF